jgi:hypothetical protein
LIDIPNEIDDGLYMVGDNAWLENYDIRAIVAYREENHLPSGYCLTEDEWKRFKRS